MPIALQEPGGTSSSPTLGRKAPPHWYATEDGRLPVVSSVFGALTWWYVDEEAGETAALSARRRSDGAPLLFYDPHCLWAQNNQGPLNNLSRVHFQAGEFHAGGVLVPPGPACYDVSVSWESGHATATLQFHWRE